MTESLPIPKRGTAAVRLRRSWPTVLIWLGLCILAALWLIPFIIILLTSLRSMNDLISNGVFAWPQRFLPENFAKAWSIGNFSVYFRNSLILILTKVPLGILIAALAAYPLAKLRFRFSNAIFILFLVGLAIPVQVTLMPLLVMMKQLGIAGTLPALVPPYVVFGLPFQIFVMRGFFRTLPNELIEAARLDGCSEFTVFWRIMLPLSAPALITLFIIDALGTWNELLIALVLINSEAWLTVPVGLLRFQGQWSSRYTELMAGVVISIAPILFIYTFLQRYLVSGLTAGALKE